MEALRILKASPGCTLQDLGRPGWRRYGIPTSGAMDQFALAAANALVGNPRDAAALEITLQGFAAEALDALRVAITGADLTALHNGQTCPLWTSFDLQRGDRIEFTRRASGCRAYLALAGGCDGPRWMNSRSMFLKGKLGEPLIVEQIVSRETRSAPGAQRTLPEQHRPKVSQPAMVRVLPGPQADYFLPESLTTFYSSKYQVSSQSDRQGLRTIGPALKSSRGFGVISEPTPPGAIQVPGDGQPIILLRDGQSTGGYAKIAQVITADLDVFAQLAPGESFRLASVERDAALAAGAAYRHRLASISSLLG